MTSPLTPPTLTDGLFDAAAVMSWLRSLGLDPAVPLIPGAVGQAIPDMPDRLGIVTDTSGGPMEADGLIDTPAFQLRFRGAQGDPYDAQRLAMTADRLILFADLPVTVAGIRLYSVTRSGGRPTALLPNPSPGLRSEYVCTYRCRVSMF